MAFIGVEVSSTEVPVAAQTSFSTANAFVVGLGDWGAPSGRDASFACTSLTNVESVIGPRTATNATLYDSLDTFFHESSGTGAVAYVTRVVGPNPTYATALLLDGSAGTAVTVTAKYVGAYGNALRIAYQGSVVTLSDSSGKVLAVSPALTTNATIATWLTGTGYVTAVVGAGTLATTTTATPFAGGDDDRTHATLANWTNALNTFDINLGPGQVIAPGKSDWGSSPLAGITTALGAHALNFNRVAIADLPDNLPAATLIADVGNTYNAAGVGPMSLWAGDQLIPGLAIGTTRTVPPSAVMAGKCAVVDNNGNPNQAAAGSQVPLNYVIGPASHVSGAYATYSMSDLFLLDDAGINTFANRYGSYLAFNFTATLRPSADEIFTEFNHQRMRMALQAEAQLIGEPFVFSQVDGQSGDINSFGLAISAMLTGYYNAGALFGATASEAFTVDVGSAVNTPTSLQAGQLNALVNVRLSPTAKQVSIVLNAVPITQALPQPSA